MQGQNNGGEKVRMMKRGGVGGRNDDKVWVMRTSKSSPAKRAGHLPRGVTSASPENKQKGERQNEGEKGGREEREC